jgi:hypothetical protein
VTRYRKRAVEVDAFQWDGDYQRLERFTGLNWGRADAKEVAWEHEDGEEVVVWNSVEKMWLALPLEYWLIRGVHGELYPCAPDIFEQTYEPVLAQRVEDTRAP